MDDVKVKFSDHDKLVGAKNYLLWAYNVKRVFKRHRVWDLVNPEDFNATPVTTTTSSSSIATRLQKHTPVLRHTRSNPLAGDQATVLPTGDTTGDTRNDNSNRADRANATPPLPSWEDRVEICMQIYSQTIH
jgi:hypothetical protein